MEENHYYAFGLKHTNYNSDQLLYQKNANDVVVLKGGTPTVQSTYKYKYNGKELQDELGLNTTAMDYRQYDSAIGRFNGMDKLSEMSHNITPYRFGFNNPAFWSDPTGLFESRKAARKYRREHGLKGRIRRAENGTFELYGKEGMVYSAGDDSPYASTDSNPNDGVIASHLAEGSVNESQKSNNNIGGIVSTGLWGVNTSVGFLSTGIAYKGQYHKMNELWHATKSSGVRFRWDSRWNNPMAKSWRATQVSKVAGVRNFSSKMTKVGGALLVADIALSGDIKPSHVINGIMLAASTTGVGTIVAAVWFIADFGTMGVNYLVNGEAKGIGDMIDESNFGKSATIKMYDGIY